MKQSHSLEFNMPCPYYYYNPVTEEEVECNRSIRVHVDPEEPQTRDYPGCPSSWEAWGCEHVEKGPMSYRMEQDIEYAILKKAEEAEDAKRDYRW